MGKGYVSSEMFAGRISSGGKVENVPFKLKNENPFSVYIRPKADAGEVDTVIDVLLYQGDAIVEMPSLLNEWSPLFIRKLNNIDLDNYDVYWGVGASGEAL